jgi:hypothetical protein
MASKVQSYRTKAAYCKEHDHVFAAAAAEADADTAEADYAETATRTSPPSSSDFRNLQIRKHMRFSECDFCVRWSSIKHDRNKTSTERLHAKYMLNGHYNWIARERTEYTSKLNPRDFLTLAIDGTDQL